MAKTDEQTPAERDTAERAPARDTEPRFPKDRLINEATGRLDTTPWELAAALHDVAPDKGLTIAEAEAALAKYLRPKTD